MTSLLAVSPKSLWSSGTDGEGQHGGEHSGGLEYKLESLRPMGRESVHCIFIKEPQGPSFNMTPHLHGPRVTLAAGCS